MARGRVTGVSLVIAATSIAFAEPAPPASAPAELRPAVIAHFSAETESIRTAIAAVDRRLRTGDVVRTHRLGAALRSLHARIPRDISPEQRIVAARRSAATRLLLTRDAAERRLLLDELRQLRIDASRVAMVGLHAAAIPLPSRISRPARGPIGRRFGDYLHERTKATLSRRGVEFDVESQAAVVAPADGVVRFVGAIRGLDRGVIVDHGNFLTVVAKLGEVTAPVGARVAEGDQIGSAADHHVYLEVRIKLGPGGLPVDPEPILAPLQPGR